MFLEVAEWFTAQVTENDLNEVAVYPELSRVRECNYAAACAAVRQVASEGLADEETLEHLEQRIQHAMCLF